MSNNKVIIKIERCKGCGFCVGECKEHIIRLSKDINKLGYNYAEIIDMSKCTGCTYCALSCPEAIIKVIKED